MGFDQHVGSDIEHQAADDAMAIFMAFNSPEVEVIGLTTIFGNVRVPDATKNALIILQQLDQTQVCVGSVRSSSSLLRSLSARVRSCHPGPRG